MLESTSNDVSLDRRYWWREREFAFLLIISVLTFCLRLSAIPLFGEEPRRALIAREMIETGDWLVPGTQGVFLASRPPLQNWMIAVMALATGSFDIWSVRLPSILSTIAAAVIVYGYLRQQIGRLGSMGGAVSFVTMLLVMEFGRSAETEAVFTVFVAASMMLWHWGWIKKWPAWRMWSVGYGLAALGMLTKGLQAPVYFVGATGLFLLVTGNWRALLTRAHLVGILVFIVIFGAWQGPFTWYRGVEDSWMIYFGDVAGRFVDRGWSKFLSHLVAYPVELLFVRLMPWSVLLLAYCSRRIREDLGTCRETVLFLTICILFSFVFVWLPPGSKARYYMPLFPSFAALVGIAIDRLAADQKSAGRSSLWTNFVWTMTCLMVGSAVVVTGVSLSMPQSVVSLSATGAFAFAAGALGFAYAARKSLAQSDDRMMAHGIYAIAGFLALLQVGVITSVQQNRCEDIAGHVNEIRQQLPANTKLVSLGLVHHAFAFFYGHPIPIIELPDANLPEGQDYFCLHTYAADPPRLPFEWTQINVISCDRFKCETVPKDRVFIGRRLHGQNVGMKDTSSSMK